MDKIYIVHRRVSYKYPDNNIEDAFSTVSRVFDTEDKAINYIRKEIVDWHEDLVEHKCSVGPITDETKWSRPGMRAFFRGSDEDASVFRILYYEICNVE